jgi:hypothetical protein
MTRVINTVSSLRERFGIGATIREVVDGLRADHHRGGYRSA